MTEVTFDDMDKYDLIDVLKECPHTYKTLLGDLHVSSCCTAVKKASRKLNNLVKEGHIYKSEIPGNMMHCVMYYHLDKKYTVLIDNSDNWVNVYYFFDYKRLEKNYFSVQEYYKLGLSSWEKHTEEKIFYEGDSLRFF